MKAKTIGILLGAGVGIFISIKFIIPNIEIYMVDSVDWIVARFSSFALGVFIGIAFFAMMFILAFMLGHMRGNDGEI